MVRIGDDRADDYPPPLSWHPPGVRLAGDACPEAAVRIKRAEVEQMMEGRTPGTTLEEALEVFEVFASGTLADEVYVIDDVGGKRIAIAPAALKAKYQKE